MMNNPSKVHILFVNEDNVLVGSMSCHPELADKVQGPEGSRKVMGVLPPTDFSRKWVLEGKVLKDHGPLFVPTYADQRRAEYPSTGDQLDALWKFYQQGDEAALAEMMARVMAVKEKYPKVTP